MVNRSSLQSISTRLIIGTLCIWPSVLVPVRAAAAVAAPDTLSIPQSDSTGAQDPIGQAKQAEQRRDFQSAAALYQKYLKTHPDDAQILQRLGLVEYLSNRFEAAIPSLARALKLDPSLWGSALYLGISDYRTARFKEAIPMLRRSLELRPGVPEAEFWLGCALVANAEPEPAIPHLAGARRDPAWEVQSEDMLVKAYRAAAERNYQRIAAVAPDSERVHLVKAQLLQWKGVNNGAVWEARQALQRNPDLEDAHRIVGEVYWREKGFELAAKEFQTELEINPLNGESNLRLGEFWLARGEAQKSAAYLSTALLERAGSPGEVDHFLGEAALAGGDYAAAMADLKRAVEQNPDDVANHRLLAQVYRATGRLDLAASEERLAQATAAPKLAPHSDTNR